MAIPGQFSLRYLFLETLCVAVALACITQALRVSPGLRRLMIIVGALFAGGANGGLFGRMMTGFLAAGILIIAVGLLLVDCGVALHVYSGLEGTQ